MCFPQLHSKTVRWNELDNFKFCSQKFDPLSKSPLYKKIDYYFYLKEGFVHWPC